MQEINDQTFEQEVLKSEIPVLIDFWAPWCGPCKMMLPLVEKISHQFEGKIKVVKLNIDDNAKIPSEYGITSIPTFILFKAGKNVDMTIGATSEKNLVWKLKNIIGEVE